MLSQRARYALKAMINLAHVDRPTLKQISAIALDENIPRKFLEGIMNELRQNGLVESARGKSGGCRLARPPELITYGEIIRVIDGPLALVPCVSRAFYRRCADCSDERTCELRQVMARVRQQVSDVLDRTSLASNAEAVQAIEAL